MGWFPVACYLEIVQRKSIIQIFIYQNLSSYMLGDPVFGAGNWPALTIMWLYASNTYAATPLCI